MRVLKFAPIFLASVLSMLAFAAFAGVNLKNGNFYISYTDLIVNDSLLVSRTYNSKAIEVGIFGIGWGSVFDTKLEIGPDGLPIIFNNGSGSESHFESLSSNEGRKTILSSSLDKMRELLATEMLEKNRARGRDQLAKEANEKLKNNEFRLRTWRRFVSAGKIQPAKIPIGEKFSSTCECSFQTDKLERTPAGFRQIAGAMTYNFDEHGRILSFADKHSRLVELDRYISGPHKGKISFARLGQNSIKFSYHEAGFISEFTDVKSGSVARYDYDGSNLIKSENAIGGIYEHSYDSNHNMTRVGYADKTDMRMKYDASGSLTEITGQDKSVTQYKYGALKGDPDLNYYTEVIYSSASGSGGIKKFERGEFRNKKKSNGEIYTSQQTSVADGIRRDLYFDERGILSQMVEGSSFSKQKITTNFSFDDLGRVE